MSGNYFREIAIAFSILFTDNSKALVVYSPRTNSSVVVRRSNQHNPQTFRSRQGQPTLKLRRNLADVKFDKTQIKRKFKHARAFNIEGTPSSGQIASYQDKLQQHVNSEKTVIIKGTYRKAPVVHYLDPESKVNVIADTNVLKFMLSAYEKTPNLGTFIIYCRKCLWQEFNTLSK